MDFTPNRLTFDQGVERIQRALEKHPMPVGRIITSRDKEVKAAQEELRVTNVPDGFSKFQLPVYFKEHSQFFFSYAGPDIQVPSHSHDEGDGIRVIMSGSIIYNSQTLSAGDWMFIPKGQPYGFTVGPTGVGMFYCYQCCCA